MSEKMTDKKKAMLKIQQLSFALVEANLYLDTHPTCEKGIAYFKKHKAALEAAKKEYEKLYGALNADNALENGSKKWDWVTTPFPWENERSDG